MNIKKLSDIEASPISRSKTWLNDLDIIYGKSNLSTHNIGMPKGKISLWAGESGVGKSRLAIEVAKKFSINYSNGVVLYFSTESPLEDFANWAKDYQYNNNIHCSDDNKIDEIIKGIYCVKPKLIFIDSVNMIEEFEIGNKKEARRLIQGVDGMPGLKKAAYDVGAHLILLGQLNQDGKTIKGGTSLPHLVDIALNVVKTDENGVFRVEVGTKHRYGSTENKALFRHTNDGVEEYVPYIAPTPVSAYHRIPAMTSSGTCRIDANGATIPGDPEFLEHMDNYKKSPEGQAYIKSKKGILENLNDKIGNFFGFK